MVLFIIDFLVYFRRHWHSNRTSSINNIDNHHNSTLSCQLAESEKSITVLVGEKDMKSKLSWKDALKWFIIMFALLAIVLGLAMGAGGVMIALIVALVVLFLVAFVLDIKSK